ncbi:hypothetical protein C8Q74DRAFT_660041 [Fomes fomentarius]|nr:hypothetical protein C8Q74DRAFT_660041 [Fomes fomentarius]
MNIRLHAGGRNFNVLLVIVESSVAHCIALILTLVLFMLDNNGTYVISDMLAHLTITFHDGITRRANSHETVRLITSIGPLTA